MVIKPDYKFGLRELNSFSSSFFNSYIRLNIGFKI